MVEQFLAYIKDNKLCTKADKVLLAVSGGIDSVVLTALFSETGFSFGLVHCNFGLRGKESHGDEKFVRKLAGQYMVPVHVRTFDTNAFARNRQISIQMAARELRYTWFEELIAEEGYHHVAVAHHLNDSLETAIYNLTKGTGIAGVRGIDPRKGNIIRPLLFASKTQLHTYAATQGLVWREDRSNASVKYHRNLIRHKVIPTLEEINPNLIQTFAHTQTRLAGAEEVMKKYVGSLRKKYAQKRGEDIYFLKKSFEGEHAVVTSELIRPYGFTYFQAAQLQAVLQTDETGRLFHSPTHCLNVDREAVIISPLARDIPVLALHEAEEVFNNGVVQLTCAVEENVLTNLLRGKHEASLNYERLQFPLTIRKWQEGDVFQPLGMKGKKKVSDFMIDEKIPLNLKERLCVLVSGEDVVWVIGHRIDERYKVLPAHKLIYNLFLTIA